MSRTRSACAPIVARSDRRLASVSSRSRICTRPEIVAKGLLISCPAPAANSASASALATSRARQAGRTLFDDGGLAEECAAQRRELLTRFSRQLDSIGRIEPNSADRVGTGRKSQSGDADLAVGERAALRGEQTAKTGVGLRAIKRRLSHVRQLAAAGLGDVLLRRREMAQADDSRRCP